ncbi:hypothetical protein [Texcoconibacillus texcoconensis]|uniref:Uncharacterized protein n=1 Tax=Texcoconibacillus texcoconensis TaxID=1095777 RepID=A0A840QC95_9BACI|nr:hypothetical protein [Texcoconibacillus texcoconensis]MBB5171940.1 hypothetical protein [Texcoconibacillus texcoconensis]
MKLWICTLGVTVTITGGAMMLSSGVDEKQSENDKMNVKESESLNIGHNSAEVRGEDMEPKLEELNEVKRNINSEDSTNAEEPTETYEEALEAGRELLETIDKIIDE